MNQKKKNFELTCKIDNYISEIKILNEKENDDEIKTNEEIIKITEKDYIIELKKLKKKENEYKNIIEEKDKLLKKINEEVEAYKIRNIELIQELSQYKK